MVTVDTTAPVITSAGTASGTYRTAFSYAITTATPAVTFAADNLPVSLSIDPATGVISGTPTTPASLAVMLRATDTAGNVATAPLALTLARAVVSVTSIFASDKIADGTTAASVNYAGATLAGVFPGDGVTLAGGSANFSDAAVGTGKTVTITGLTLVGTHAANYQLASTTVTTTASITQQPIAFVSMVFDGLIQTYDGAPKPVSVLTVPGGVSVSVTYDGSPVPPTAAGSYTVNATVTAVGYAGSSSVAFTIARAPQTIAFDPPELNAGEPATLRATSTSGLPVAFELVSGNATLIGATLTPRDGNPIVVRAVQTGGANHLPASVERTFTAFAKLPQSIDFATLVNRMTTDAPFLLSATASSGLPVTFAVVSGPASLSGATLTLTGAPGSVVVRALQPGDADYAAASEVERAFVVTERVLGRFINFSARARIGTGDGVLIAGFSLGGAAEKPLLVRAVGPGLTAFGVAGALANPNIRIVHNGAIVAENDNWTAIGGGGEIAAVAARVNAFPLSTASTDAALLTPVPPGTYTAQVSGADGGTGVALTEIYEASGVASATEPCLLNFSVRAEAGAGENMLIVGFVLAGDTPSRVLIRGIGPTLALFGVANAITNPQLSLRDAAGTLLGENDDWNPVDAATAQSAGAFPLPLGSQDAALVLTLNPGAYTVQLASSNSATGIALLEVYEMP
ncbi:MAG: MBG domain-containing protein [Verrucomicrobiota bacterium]